MKSNATDLGDYVLELMQTQGLSNRALASTAGVSESAVRNLLRYGRDKSAKDPDARTLSLIAKALNIDSLRLFRLAGYVPPEPDAHSVRADYLAETFDRLPLEKQDAIMSVLEAMADIPERRNAIRRMREEPQNPLAGLDLAMPGMIRVIANDLLAKLDMRDPLDVELIKSDIEILGNRWGNLPQETQERVKALIRRKLSLEYDPTMVDPEWRS